MTVLNKIKTHTTKTTAYTDAQMKWKKIHDWNENERISATKIHVWKRKKHEQKKNSSQIHIPEMRICIPILSICCIKIYIRILSMKAWRKKQCNRMRSVYSRSLARQPYAYFDYTFRNQLFTRFVSLIKMHRLSIQYMYRAHWLRICMYLYAC